MSGNARILVVFAHPALERARAAPALLTALQGLPDATVRDLYELYPDFAVDVPAEQALLREHDAVVLQFPLYWYAAPALLKEWMDVTWLHGFAYGTQGCALRRKTLGVAITTGGSHDAFHPLGVHGHDLKELLLPFEQAARLCDMRWAEPFVLHDVPLLDAAGLEAEGLRYRDHLQRLGADAVRVRA